MARIVAVVVAALLLISVLWWRVLDRQPEVSLPAGQPEVTSAEPVAAPVGSRQAPVLPGTILDSCDSNSDEQLEAERVAAFAAQQDELLRVLSASADAEHLLVAALSSLHSDQEQAMTLLSDAAARDPRHPLIAAQLLMLCIEIDACSRARPEMERNLIAADKGNAIAWVEVARSRLQRNDERGALAALREAAAAAAVEDYFTDYIYLFDRGLAAAAGGLVKLPKQIPSRIAMELALTGDFISAERAADLGLGRLAGAGSLKHFLKVNDANFGHIGAECAGYHQTKHQNNRQHHRLAHKSHKCSPFFVKKHLFCEWVIPSPILGPKGNREFFISLKFKS